MSAPLLQEIPYQDPLSVIAYFAQESGAVFFDSAQLREHCGRYSFIALDPFMLLQSKNGMIHLDGLELSGDPFEILTEQLKKFPLTMLAGLPPFQGGAAGFFSYDLYPHLEKIASQQMDDMHFPDLVMGFYDLVIAFDHEKNKAWIFSSGYPEQEKSAREKYAKERLSSLQNKLIQVSR